jgi:hypothetical protein
MSEKNRKRLAKRQWASEEAYWNGATDFCDDFVNQVAEAEHREHQEWVHRASDRSVERSDTGRLHSAR